MSSSTLLRICTAGSVDDGKSTLIGRLLYDAQSVYEDQLLSVEKASKNRSAGPIDFSLFTDGLRAEREQGITIDVAYRYFATTKRKFILADTPGHEQYTRNMATGASTADVAILLVDARHGILDQSRRHARIARLLGIRDFVLAVNKMDLVDFDCAVFDGIANEFATILAGASMHPIPMSALLGDNVIALSDKTPWFRGPALLPHLEAVEVDERRALGSLRLPVQVVIRPDQDFRGYGGQILSGTIRVGDHVTAWPSLRSSRVERLVTFDGDIEVAFAPMSVTVVLEDEVDISRGDIITDGHVHMGHRFQADVVWMDERPCEPNRLYVIKHSSGTTTAQLDTRLMLNDIGKVTVDTSRALIFDKYSDMRGMGAFIIIEPTTNFTAGAGMISAALSDKATASHPGAAERIAHIARSAHSEGEAIEAVRRVLEEILI
jgi:sulfate adenylyltransferase large subunit